VPALVVPVPDETALLPGHQHAVAAAVDTECQAADGIVFVPPLSSVKVAGAEAVSVQFAFARTFAVPPLFV
jgi:hypothetical protein